jgi:membrane protease YdiL (CAAX protease family)
VTGAYESVPAGDGVTAGVGALVIVIPLILAVLVQSSTEEAMFRGYVQQLTGTQLAGWTAVLVPSIGFAAAHFDLHVFVMANIVLVAILFSFLALRIGTIWLVCGIHCGWNWAQGNLFGIPVSGIPVDVSILRFAPDSSTADWLTGGEFGIEGSAVTTVVLALAAFVAYRWWSANPRSSPLLPTT